ncbi:MAG: hypothetical protein JWO94_2221 [Verrucomicrobiaceae bacterium]|nr:hypothetical protein [Verrucomicrobiaceae bacterium]
MRSSPDAIEPLAPRPRLPAFGRLLLWCVLTIAVPVLVLGRVMPDIGLKTVPLKLMGDEGVMDLGREIAALKSAGPDYVGIGNSMLYTRLGRTPDQMNALTGKKFFFIIKDGSASAAWYLTLKNLVAASGVKPRVVFFFIRDNDITSPKFRTAGRSELYINSLRTLREPVLDKLLGTETAQVGLIEGVSDWLNGPTGCLNFTAWDDKFPHRVSDMAMDLGGGGGTKLAQREALAQRFAIEHLRGDVAADMPASNADSTQRLDSYNKLSTNYGEAEDHSFLPAMMEVAREHGIKLLFFRVKRRPDELGNVSTETPQLRLYARQLKQWIEAHGGLFFEETDDSTILESDYLDGDHIRPERLGWYQEYFWKRMEGVFP